MSNQFLVALSGNPNVGKSTIFNGLTGMHQHTGNWPGKTVSGVTGKIKYGENKFILADIPGTYSLLAHSREEEVARDFICLSHPDAVIVVCDATCLERNLNLLLQTAEINSHIILCVNLMDQAKKKGIRIDLKKLSDILKIPVIGCSAAHKTGLSELLKTLSKTVTGKITPTPYTVTYTPCIEKAVNIILSALPSLPINPRWFALKLLMNDDIINKNPEFSSVASLPNVVSAIKQANEVLYEDNITHDMLTDIIVSYVNYASEKICKQCVTFKNPSYAESDRRIDKILTGRLTGIPIMILMLALIFYITVSGANLPSAFLSYWLFKFQDVLLGFFSYLHVPKFITELLVLGVYRVTAWVVSVMLPPMAIFFPLFTILEDLGYLPRIAFNMDKIFKKCSACGKQALTMCMGFGCNAVGVTGCRIIDSKRERLIAVLTNCLVPCNGRFPTLISLITMFFAFSGILGSLYGALLLTLCVILGVCATFLMSKILSVTLLKGQPSAFTLELPPYRKPQFLKVIVRSIWERTLYVLGRAVSVAAPAGLIIWLLANLQINDASLLIHTARFLDPFARIMGLDGVILLGFILGFPANEIVIPIIIMAYTASGSIYDFENLFELKLLLQNNGWTLLTALNVMLFTLFHWPCSTTLLTIKKETGSFIWTFFAFLLPTLLGILLCLITTFLFNIINF